MLILTRKAGESLVIANTIVVTVIGTNNGQVRLGIEAPAHVVVDREEIHQRRQAELQTTTPLEHYSRLAAQAKGEQP
jgi:carbon storage regulator